MRLSRKVALLAVANLLLLAAVLFVFFRSQFQSGTQSLLLGPVQDRIMAIANRFSVELSGAPEAAVDSILASYRQRYQADRSRRRSARWPGGRAPSRGAPTHTPSTGKTARQSTPAATAEGWAAAAERRAT
jgi:hypothetical protein